MAIDNELKFSKNLLQDFQLCGNQFTDL